MKKLLFALVLLCCLSPPVFGASYPIQQSVNTVSGSTATLDGLVIPQSFVAGYTWVSVQLTGSWTGTVTWEVSNDNVNWSPAALIVPSSVGGGMISTATTNGTYHGPKGSFLYFRARLSTAGSGTVIGLASFSPAASAIQAKGDTTGQCVGTVTSFDVDGGTTGFTFTGGPITSSGTITMEGAPSTLATVATYNGIPTVDNGVPAEYAQVDLTGQTAAIAATTVYAVPSSGVGMYRVSYVAKLTTVAGTSSVLGGSTGFQVKYTDATDSVVTTTAASATSNLNTTQAQISGSIIVYAKASTNIQYLIGYTSVADTEMAYNLHIKVESL